MTQPLHSALSPDFTDHVALVTGGSRGIGRAITLAFAQRGCQVVFCYRSDHAAARAVCAEVQAIGGQTTAIQADVSSRIAVDALVAQVLATYGRIDILVNNAGLFPQQAVVNMQDQDWEQVLHTNLFAVFYLCRAILPTMITASAGAIINMASIAGQRGSANHAHYAAAKGGVLAFTRSLAREVAQHNIRVNAVSPGRIETELLMEQAGNGEYERWMRDTPAKRLGSPEEVAAAVVFLASPASRYIIGETLAVNGGLLMD